jgi:hypothetical protein
MIDPYWYEALPDEVFTWLDTIKAQATDIVSITIHVKKAKIRCHYMDPDNKQRQAVFNIKENT